MPAAQLNPDLSALELVLEERGAGQVEHLAGSLLEHLRRTARTLDSWGADPVLVSAGLLHAAYGTQGFATAFFRLEERAKLRALIGEEAEAVVYAYCALDREYYMKAGTEVAQLCDRFRGERFTPSARMRQQLAELTAANELDVIENSLLSAAAAISIRELVAVGERFLSEAARAAFRGEDDVETQVDPEIAYLDLGTHGERILLWHGGAGPELTWSRQHSLSAEYRLRIPWRRGLAPSVPVSVHDWEPDTRDLLRIMPGSVHVVAHSWGGLSALVAAARAPERLRSLVVIEPPLWTCAELHPEVEQLATLSRAFFASEPDARSAFFALASQPLDHLDSARIERYAHRVRDPAEARPDFTRLREAQLPIAIVSGEHALGLERVCDELANTLGAARWRLKGAGHSVQRHPEFNAHLRNLVAAASGSR